MEIDMNWVAILAGGVLAMVMGAIWYSPKVFGEKWMKSIGMSQKEAKAGETRGMITAIIRSFILSFSLYHIIYVTAQFYANDSFLVNAMQVGAWVGISIVALTMVMHDTFEQRPKYATKVHVGFEIVTIFLVATVIGIIAG